MGRIFITFVLTSAFWIWYYSDYVKVEDANQEQATTETVTKSDSPATPPATTDVATTPKSPTTKEAKEAPKAPKVTKTPATTSTTTDVAAMPKSPTTTPTTTNVKKTPETPNTAPATTSTTTTDVAEAPKTQNTAPATTSTPLGVENLYGKWQPIEGAECPLEFTKYGAVIQTDKYGFLSRYAYAVNKEQMKIKYDNAQFKLYAEAGTVYLEIYNSDDFSGRYKRVAKPREINATPLPREEYSNSIVGKWTPLNGHTEALEITKFGTVIQTDKYGFDSRYGYSLSEDKLAIKYDKNARVAISEDANYYYLEIYNTTDFSGRYLKKK